MLKELARRAMPHSAYRLYRRRKIARLVAGYRVRDVEHSYGGHRFTVRLADPLAEGWYDHDWEPAPEISFLREHGALVSGATVFDAGAHQGIVALMLAAEVGGEGTVVAVEAEPHNARMAEANRDLNRATNLKVIHAAVGSASGRLMFAEGLNGHVERTRAGNVAVPAVTIDQLAFEFGWPDVVYLDVEGFEGEALLGAERVLERGRTSFFVEVHQTLPDYGFVPADILRRLSGLELHASPGQRGDYAPAPPTLPPGPHFVIALAPRQDRIPA